MKIAVVGTGISGNLAARLLASQHEVDLFEPASHVGGHAHTVDVEAYGRIVSADVAFMVLNRRTYPNFCRLLDLLEVELQNSDMSLSVRCWKTGLEYQGSSINGLFAQRRNLASVSFYRMLSDILRFNARAVDFCSSGEEALTLGQFLADIGVGKAFRERYLVPMSAAIWSADPTCLDAFPAKFILGFFRNHGLLQLRDRPRWLTVKRRSRNYVSRLVRPLAQNTFVNASVQRVQRVDGGVRVSFARRQPAVYDHVVLASHADQSLKLLVDADRSEREILAAFPYQSNSAVLHTDESVLPRRKRAWASWNYHIPVQSDQPVSVTYDLNRLQKLGLPGPLCLTLNPNMAIEQGKVIGQFEFAHPVFSAAAIEAQRRFAEINGRRGISFCGAYWGYGFHEDGVNSALAVARGFGLSLDQLANDREVDRIIPQLSETSA